MDWQDVTVVEQSVSAATLNSSYRNNERRYHASYPDVKNPSALLEGITKFIQQFSGGQIPDHAFIYVVENPEAGGAPEESKYFFMLSKKKNPKTGNTTGYSLRLLYAPTREVESISMIEEDKVVWSPDNMENSLHKVRTQYYMGFVYMLCLWSPGYDIEPEPEVEMTAAELLNYAHGEIPPSLIEIELPEQGEEVPEPSEKQQTETPEVTEGLFEVPEPSETESQQYAVPEVDDTEVVLVSPENYEDEYNDLQTDYEELFE